jgi:hypothetical protein
VVWQKAVAHQRLWTIFGRRQWWLKLVGVERPAGRSSGHTATT